MTKAMIAVIASHHCLEEPLDRTAVRKRGGLCTLVTPGIGHKTFLMSGTSDGQQMPSAKIFVVLGSELAGCSTTTSMICCELVDGVSASSGCASGPLRFLSM